MLLVNPTTQRYCGAEPRLADLQPTRVQGTWSEYVVPISDFKCESDLVPQLTQMDFQNTGNQNVQVCLGDLQLVK